MTTTDFPSIGPDGTCDSCGAVRRIGDWPDCPHGRPYLSTPIAAIHVKERSVIYRNPRTGETRTPARSDQPMPEVYARQGYERVELDTPQAIRTHERETGSIHEATWYDSGSGRAERDLVADHGPALPDISNKILEMGRAEGLYSE